MKLLADQLRKQLLKEDFSDTIKMSFKNSLDIPSVFSVLKIGVISFYIISLISFPQGSIKEIMM